VYAVDTFKGTTLDPKSQPAWTASVAKTGGSTLPWWPKVLPGGLVMFHDYDERHLGVRRFVDEALIGPLRGCATEQVGGLLWVRSPIGARGTVLARGGGGG